ncbi:cell division protein FtsA [Candidatus Absconditicoccus praedator]|uniref:cell division protein FtsA n=1 Tax=Candidatus Absconditicoccus praedator TaxID=2735562 RepID=UPI001E34D644|nr:cell division protein FtsA [Candidatus Absconditicoccus praedator]UFX83493.1 cell division protein FtsA [Candidatus Absconditicoccus praedator]
MQDLKLVLDLGNGYIKGIIFAKEGDSTVVISKDTVKTKGMRKGKILDVDDFVYSIRALFESFEKKLGGDFIDEIYVGLSHPDMKIKRISEQKRVMNESIQQDDMDHLTNLISETSGEQNYETIKIIPVQWIIDEQMRLKDPTGMQGKKLEITADVFSIPKNFYNTLVEVFEKLEIDVVDIVPNLLGASESAIDFDDKDLGTLLIDIGNNQTSFVVYEEGFPITYGVVPIGGEEVTKDISIGLQVDIKDAEKIKKEKGTALLEDQSQEDESIDVAFLSDVITARYEEIFEHINEYLVQLGKDSRLPGGVVLVGGGAKMNNVEKLSKEYFKLVTFFGKDKVYNISDVSTKLQYINTIGVNAWVDKYGVGSGGFSMSMGVGLGWVKKVIKYIKDMF